MINTYLVDNKSMAFEGKVLLSNSTFGLDILKQTVDE